MRESDIRKYLLKCVKQEGGEVRKVRWIGRRGAPDELVLLERFSSFVELKVPGEYPTMLQEAEHRLLRWAGIPVAVVDSMEDVEKLVFKKCLP